jgi:hypothetical protein
MPAFQVTVQWLVEHHGTNPLVLAHRVLAAFVAEAHGRSHEDPQVPLSQHLVEISGEVLGLAYAYRLFPEDAHDDGQHSGRILES